MAKIITDDQERIGRWLNEKIRGIYAENTGSYIGLEQDGKIIAATGYEDYTGKSVRTHIAIEGKITKEFLRFIFWYPFEQLKVKKLIGLVSGGNEKALKLDKNFGFVEEAIVKDVYEDGDLHILTMTKEQCRFLTDRSNRQKAE